MCERGHSVVTATFSDPAEHTLLLRPFDAGRPIRDARKTSGLTQAQLAAGAGVSVKWLSDAENGKPAVELGSVMEVIGRLGYALVRPRRPAPAFDLAAHIEAGTETAP